jgi:hypothetical protein
VLVLPNDRGNSENTCKMSESPAQRESTHPFLQRDGSPRTADSPPSTPPLTFMDNSVHGDVVFDALVASSSLNSSTTPLWLQSQSGALQMAFSIPSSACVSPQHLPADTSTQLPSSTYEETVSSYLESNFTDSGFSSPRKCSGGSMHMGSGQSQAGLKEHVAAEVIQEMFRRHHRTTLAITRHTTGTE